MKKIIEKMNHGLHKKCDALSPQKRRVLVICSLIVFAALAVYTAIDAIILSDNRRQLPEVEHIKKLDLPKLNKKSMNPSNFNNHDDDDE